VPYSTPFCAGKYKQEPKINKSAKAEFLAYSEFCPEPTRHKRVSSEFKSSRGFGTRGAHPLEQSRFRATRYKRVFLAISEFDRFNHINSFYLIFCRSSSFFLLFF